MTNLEMREFEQHLHQQEQVKKLRLTSIMSHMDTCLDCNLVGKFMYRQGGRGLCPVCDKAIIEAYKQRTES